MEKILRTIKKIIPKKILGVMRPVYHYSLAFVGAVIYRFPSKKIKVVAITGTKGKTSTAELVNSILEEAGYKTALAGTLRIKIGNTSRPNLFKMTMPGRFFVQKFLRNTVDDKCDYAIIEMTSEGAKQFRHKFIDLDAFIFLNISPEHIESHGSYEKYLDAKLSLANSLAQSDKKRKVLVVNTDDKEASKFLAVPVLEKYSFSIIQAEPYLVKKDGVELTFQGAKISSALRGKFNIYNILAATTFATTQNIPTEKIVRGVEKLKEIKGRVQSIYAGQNFDVVVDYAHTADSLTKLYETFGDQRKICVLGNTGGGRDKWKRPEMAKVAEKYCDEIILTNEDPYDEDPEEIIKEMSDAIENKNFEKIIDRREAIRHALKIARSGDVVLITGKGTDPYIMGKNGSKIPWSDAGVVTEELLNIIK
ncbi:MAG: UDP-N-acetylmuramyl-tripeptide synthetase [Candidatus Paceibacterota bacterium]